MPLILLRKSCKLLAAESLESQINKHVEWCRKNYPSLFAPETIPSKRKRKGMGAGARRRERERNAGNGWTAEQWQACIAFYGAICLRCGCPENLVPDHITPLYVGGVHELENIQPLCSKCNIWKGLKVIDFRQGKIFSLKLQP